MKWSSLVLAGLVIWLAGSISEAEVIIDVVPVGNPGNADDTHGDGYGGVDYRYNIGKYEVSNAEYTEFLNAVDLAGFNLLGLYSGSMGISFDSGADEGLKYSVGPGRGNKPVNYVSFWDACRFANWLHNGQGTGDTEDGAYTLTTDGIANNTVTRNADWLWAVTSEDEWYKAAYYDGGSGVYYNYPTGSDTAPTAQGPPGISTPPGSANYDFAAGDLTDVGAYDAKPSDSPYETFDQGGNVWEWNEAIVSTSYRGVRGGSFHSLDDYLHASHRGTTHPTYENSNVGFRVASIPEPGSITLLVCGLLAGLMWWRRGR